MKKNPDHDAIQDAGPVLSVDALMALQARVFEGSGHNPPFDREAVKAIAHLASALGRAGVLKIFKKE